MRLKDDMIKSITLGLEKYATNQYEEWEELSQKIIASTSEKEEVFLKFSGAALLMHEAGSGGIKITERLEGCAQETKQFTNRQVGDLLALSIKMKDDHLLEYILYKCSQSNRVVQPGVVHVLLDKALELKKNKTYAVNVCGETGKWLCKLNPNWHSLLEKTEEENVWETGNPTQRESFLATLRKERPHEVIELLNDSIKTEPSEIRTNFIELLAENLSLNDEPFLESMLSDKSQKVKSAVLRLLKKLDGSRLNQLYLQYALKVIQLKEERYMLVAKKKVLNIVDHIQPDPELFATGIEKISNQKGVSDPIFWLAQVLEFTHPTKLSNALGISDGDLLKLLMEHPGKEVFLPYLINSSIHYHHVPWAIELLELENISSIELFNLIPESKKSRFYTKMVSSNAVQLVNFICDGSYKEMDHQLAATLIDKLEKEPYALSQATYVQMAFYFPMSIKNILQKKLDAIDTQTVYPFYRNQITEILRMIDIKNQLTFE